MTVRVPLAGTRDDSYDILIDAGLLASLPELLRERCPAARYALVTDSHVEPLLGRGLRARLEGAGLAAELLAFPAGERNKTRETWADLSDRMLARRFGRDAAVLALGGGVVGDVAGFVAATYHRGIPWVQVPTTLLAMIDASIGGKTGLDVAAGKNLIGAFHQPRLVVADLDTLRSLPAPQRSAGLAEAVKHGAVADAAYFEWLERYGPAALAGDPSGLRDAVRRSVEIKADVVAADEREAGRRAILNAGHTVAHAIEVVSRYELLHGEAVAIGLCVESALAERLGVAEAGTAGRIRAALLGLQLPVDPPEHVGVNALLEAMQGDKKSRGGRVRFALVERIGAAHQTPGGEWTVPVEADLVEAVLRS